MINKQLTKFKDKNIYKNRKNNKKDKDFMMMKIKKIKIIKKFKKLINSNKINISLND
jgi:hypothetical protein